MAGILFSSCEKNDNSVIDPVLHFPVIDSANITPITFDTNSVHITAYCHVSSVDPVQKLTAKVINPLNNEVANITLSGDVNNNFTGVIDFTMDCRIIGQYRVEFLALTNANLYSNAFPKNINVINSHDHNPLISNLFISPKDVHLGDTIVLSFEVNVVDPDGSCDISEVYYDGTDPNHGQLTRHHLYDDGSCCPVEGFSSTSGDTTANDGKYTRILIGPPQLLGYYVYHIKAIDRSDSSSNVLTDSIFVHQ